MSELNDLLTTRELQRWRLILGEAAETTLCGLDGNARRIDHATGGYTGAILSAFNAVNGTEGWAVQLSQRPSGSMIFTRSSHSR